MAKDLLAGRFALHMRHLSIHCIYLCFIYTNYANPSMILQFNMKLLQVKTLSFIIIYKMYRSRLNKNKNLYDFQKVYFFKSILNVELFSRPTAQGAEGLLHLDCVCVCGCVKCHSIQAL